MAKLSDYAALGGNPAALDRIPLVDVSDTSMAASGTTKYALASEVYAGALASNANISAIAALADPNADRLTFWDDSAGAIAYLTAGTGLVITDTTIAADIGTSGAKIPLLNGANTWSGQNIFALGTITTSQPLTISSTLNAGGVTFEGLLIDWTSTASAAGSMPINVKVGGSSVFNVTKSGNVLSGTDGTASAVSFGRSTSTNTGMYFPGANQVGCAANGTPAWLASSTVFNSVLPVQLGGSSDTFLHRATSNSVVSAGTSSGLTTGPATSCTRINKAVASIADATATTVFTVTVPNAAHSATIQVELCGSLGAGGAIGANEATGSVSYNVSIARTAGVNAVASISAAYGSSTAAVAGATTITVTGDLGAVSGAVGATNTFTIRVTITKGGGSSANHTCVAVARLLNANASGITIA